MAAVLRDLMARRVPHYLGTYVAGGWVTIEFTSWLVNRYVLSDHLIDFVGLSLLLFAPSVFILAYYHGAPGRDQSTRLERAALSANVAIAILILVIAFSGTDLGAATTTVSIRGAAGEAVTVRIPKAEFRRRVALFPFVDLTNDPELDWLPLGLDEALVADLSQDPFVKVARLPPYDGDGGDRPFAQKLELATRSRLEFLVSGTVSRTSEGVAATVELHDVESGRLIQERQYTATDLFTLVDTLSFQLKDDIGIPAGHLRTVRDLPVSELMTSSETAFRLYIEGREAESWTETAEKFEAATAEDPTFALAYMNLYSARRGMGRREEAAKALELAMQHSYRLPETDRNLLSIQYFWVVEHDAQKALSVAEQWATLFPDEVRPHFWVAEMNEANGNLEEAIASHRRILEVDSLETGSLATIASLEETLGRFDRALEALEEYGRRQPENASQHLSKARLERRLGRHDSAIASCEQARLIQPRNVDALRCLGSIELDLGRVGEALERFEQALELSGSPGARAAVHLSLADYYERLGQPGRALEERARHAAEMEGSGMLETQETSLRTSLLPLLVMAGRIEEAFDTLEVIRDRVEPGWSFLRWQSEMLLFGALQDAEQLGVAVDSLAEYLPYAPVAIRPWLLRGRGRLMELAADYDGAAEQYREALEVSPVETDVLLDLGRSLLALGDAQQARDQFNAYLTVYPHEPRARVGLAKAMVQLGQVEEAARHLDAALAVWSEAEAGFQPAIEARKLRSELGAASG